MKGNIIDITLGILAYEISIQKKRAHNLYPSKNVEDFKMLNYISMANIFALTIHIDFYKTG